MPGSSVTIERRVPVRRLNSVDLPTFGRPTMTMDGSFVFISVFLRGRFAAASQPISVSRLQVQPLAYHVWLGWLGRRVDDVEASFDEEKAVASYRTPKAAFGRKDKDREPLRHPRVTLAELEHPQAPYRDTSFSPHSEIKPNRLRR